MNKGGRWVEGSIYHTRKVIWANGNILWTYQFTGNILDYDKWAHIVVETTRHKVQ